MFHDFQSTSYDSRCAFSDEDEYRRLRRQLVRYFTAHGCRCAADAADDTVSRVLLTWSRRPPECSLERWSFGVARNVLREYRRSSARTVAWNPAVHGKATRTVPELSVAFLPLSSSDRAFFRAYFLDETPARDLARELGLSEPGVRARALRIRRRVRASFVTAPHRHVPAPPVSCLPHN